MQKFFPSKYETVRALREVILSIVETNLNETKYIEPFNQMVDKVFSSFQKTIYFSNGIYVGLIDEQIIVRISVNVYRAHSLVNDLLDLQKRIYDDVYELTGYKLNSIHIKVRSVIADENKKAQ